MPVLFFFLVPFFSPLEKQTPTSSHLELADKVEACQLTIAQAKA
jgi:hypothetical protein